MCVNLPQPSSKNIGLDSVEILMKVEDTFGIKIPDQEAEKIITVGNFHDAVWRHLSGKQSDKCKSQGLYYKLRKSFANSFNFPTQQFNLNTSPELIFPKSNRRQEYFAFSNETNLKLPNLILTKPWAKILTTFGLITIIGGLVTSLVLINFYNYSKWTLLFCLAGIIMTILLSELFNPMRTLIKETTIREFIQRTLALNFTTLSTEQGTSRKEMESVVNYIISDLVGLDIEEISPDKKIADDLGID